MAETTDLLPSHFSIEGQLRFVSEDTLDDELDNIGLSINGQDYWEFEDISEVDFEPLFRSFKMWVPHELLKTGTIEIKAIRSDDDSALVFKPATKSLELDNRDLDKNVGINFKVIEGMFVQG